MKKRRILIFLWAFFFPISLLASPTRIVWPENVAPKDVYPFVVSINDYADAFLVKNKLQYKEPKIEVPDGLSPMVVFQLHLSIIQLLHHYELALGLRPVPIVTSSPIKYYPADVKFLTELIMGRLKKIALHYGVKKIPHQVIKEQEISPNQVFQQSLSFYLKLLMLTGDSEITQDQLYDQYTRAVHELRNIVIHQLPTIGDVKRRRILAASLQGLNPYGGKALKTETEEKSVEDLYKKSLKIRKMIIPLLKKQRITFIPVPKKALTKVSAVDVFIQSQIILAELSEWKDIIDVATSSPITAQAESKTNRDVYQELLEIEFILDKLLKYS